MRILRKQSRPRGASTAGPGLAEPLSLNSFATHTWHARTFPRDADVEVRALVRCDCATTKRSASVSRSKSRAHPAGGLGGRYAKAWTDQLCNAACRPRHRTNSVVCRLG